MKLDKVIYNYRCDKCNYEINKEHKLTEDSVICPNCYPLTIARKPIELEKVIVTRFRSLINYLKKVGLADVDTKIISYATPEAIKNKHVIGKLPYSLAKYASKYTEIRLRTPEDLKGKELTAEDLEFYVVSRETFTVLGVAE